MIFGTPSPSHDKYCEGETQRTSNRELSSACNCRNGSVLGKFFLKPGYQGASSSRFFFVFFWPCLLRLRMLLFLCVCVCVFMSMLVSRDRVEPLVQVITLHVYASQHLQRTRSPIAPATHTFNIHTHTHTHLHHTHTPSTRTHLQHTHTYTCNTRTFNTHADTHPHTHKTN